MEVRGRFAGQTNGPLPVRGSSLGGMMAEMRQNGGGTRAIGPAVTVLPDAVSPGGTMSQGARIVRTGTPLSAARQARWSTRLP